MSGSNPSALAWDVESQMLVVGYASGVIDFFSDEGVRIFTMSDIKDSNLIGDKTINSLVPGGLILTGSMRHVDLALFSLIRVNSM